MLELMLHNRSSMNAQQQKLDNISNNLANMDTDGYKTEKVAFSDLVYDTMKRSGIAVSTKTGTEVEPETGTGVKTTGYLRDTSQGALEQTNVSTNLALSGEGYFKVTKSDGTAAYERSGDFSIDGAGKLVDSSGNRLEVNFTNGAVALNASNFSVSEDGTVSVQDGTTSKNVGKINVYNVVGQDALISAGENIYVPVSGAQMYQTNTTTIEQGYVEKSNVDVSKEMTDMIQAQRAYQLNGKCLSTADQMWQMVNNMAAK